jgi:hypothetical protein
MIFTAEPKYFCEMTFDKRNIVVTYFDKLIETRRWYMKITQTFTIGLLFVMLTIGTNFSFLTFQAYAKVKLPPPPEVQFSPDIFILRDATIPFSGKRLVYLHGLRGNHNDLLKEPAHGKLATDLVASGWQVVMFDLPFTEGKFFSDGGAAYRKKIQEAMRDVDARSGVSSVNVIGGISFGGLHAFIGTADGPEFSGYFAILPIIYINSLVEFYGTAVPILNPLADVTHLSNRPGFVVWGSQDERINFRNTEALFNLLVKGNAPIKGLSYRGGEHSIMGDLDFIRNWLIQSF